MLEMGEPRHYRPVVLLRKGQQHLPQPDKGCELLEDILPEAEPHAGHHLVVPGPADVQPATYLLPHRGDEGGLYSGMNILEPFVERGLRHSFVINVKERREQTPGMLVPQDLLFIEHHHVRNIHQDIGIGDAAVRRHGREKVHHVSGTLSCQTAASHHVSLHYQSILQYNKGSGSD